MFCKITLYLLYSVFQQALNPLLARDDAQSIPVTTNKNYNLQLNNLTRTQ